MNNLSIIPEPSKVVMIDDVCKLLPTMQIIAKNDLNYEAIFLSRKLAEITGFKIEVLNKKLIHKNLACIKIVLNKAWTTEKYKLEVSEDSIKITGANKASVFYGIQSLLQLVDKSTLTVPAVIISDSPRFPWRGIMLDVGRHLFAVQDIKKMLDIMAFYKLNVFHWHLTEDQGWRIEIKKYPQLTSKGSIRKETLIGRSTDEPNFFDNTLYGGFYTQTEIREVVAYAEKLHITVVPEIDIPGHCSAAIAAYPELGHEGTSTEVKTFWGVFDDGVLNVKNETFEFIFNVLSEVMELFPSKYIHIGGDEAPKTMWENDPFAQQVIKNKKLNGEDGLQSYFIQRVEKFLNKSGRELIGWDEILEGGLAPNASVMAWRGENAAIKAANSGHDVVVTTSQKLYFNMYQGNEKTEPFAHGGYTPLHEVYSYDPILEKIDPDKRKHIMGVQACLWTEFIKDFDFLCYMGFPRIFALAEMTWSSPDKKNWNNFKAKIEKHFQYLKDMNINYRKTDSETYAKVIDE